MESLMPSLSVEIKTTPMATSTKMFRMVAGIENLYYALLFIGDPARAKTADTWRSWHQLGFHMSVKNPPPAARASEKVMVTLDVSGEPDLVINVEGGDAKAIGALKTVLAELDRVRGKRGKESEAARLAAVKGDSAIAAHLLDPLHNALNNTGCALAVPDFDFAINRALTVLAHPEVTSLRVGA
jgi:D-aminopeptidase